MNSDQGNGSIEVQGVRCWFPPAPKKQDIINYGLPTKKQKWARIELPIFTAKDVDIWSDDDYKADDVITWEEAARQEHIKIFGTDPYDLDKQGNAKDVSGVEVDINYSMECLEGFRARELDRFYNGVWIYIKGQLLYLPGCYYFYLNYWQLKDGYAEFRYIDLELFWVWEAVRKSKNLLGMVYVTMKGAGKSYIAGCIDYYETVTHRKANTTIQSKSDDDAAIFFRDKILLPVTGLPDFLIPIHKHPGDITSLNSLEFVPKARKGMSMRHFLKMKKEALYSKMHYHNAGEYAAEGGTWDLIVFEEIGKTSPTVADVYKRLMAMKLSVLRVNKKLGNIFASSTVEEMDEGGAECLKIWQESNQYEIGETNTTNTGLVRFFRSAIDATMFDEYGFSVGYEPEDKETKKYIVAKYGEVFGKNTEFGAKAVHDAKRKALKHDTKALISYMQKNPYNEKEAFWINADDCIYNAQILLEAKERILESDRKFTRRGDIVWKLKDKEAQWIDNDKNGKWEVSFFDFLHNDVQINEGAKNTFTPKASHKRVMAFDPYSNRDLVREDRGSNAAAVVYNKPDFHIPEEYCDTIIADYLYRHDDPFDSYEDIICACFFFGCEVLIEKNKSNALDYFRQRGYCWGYDNNPSDFVMSRPESTLTQYGNKISDGIVSSDPMIEHYTNSTARHIELHGRKLKHLRPIDDWLVFRPQKTQLYDMAVAASYSIVAAEKKINEQSKVVDITGIFKTYDNTKGYSKVNLN